MRHLKIGWLVIFLQFFENFGFLTLPERKRCSWGLEPHTSHPSYSAEKFLKELEMPYNSKYHPIFCVSQQKNSSDSSNIRSERIILSK